eukprot:753889-Hanusia_phi.AAC.1
MEFKSPPRDNQPDVRWIIATDLPDIIPDLREALGAERLVWWDAPQDDGTGVQNANRCHRRKRKGKKKKPLRSRGLWTTIFCRQAMKRSSRSQAPMGWHPLISNQAILPSFRSPVIEIVQKKSITTATAVIIISRGCNLRVNCGPAPWHNLASTKPSVTLGE